MFPKVCSQLSHQCSKRGVFIREGLINKRTICAQSESFCFGKVSSFRQGRVGTRKQLKMLENEEVRGGESGRNGMAKGHTAARPLISQPHQSLGLRSFAWAPASQPCALVVASCCLGKQNWQEMNVSCRLGVAGIMETLNHNPLSLALPAGFLAGLVVRPQPVWQVRGPLFPGKWEAPPPESRRNTYPSGRRSGLWVVHSSVSWTGFLFSRTHEKDGYRWEGADNCFQHLLWVSEIHAVLKGKGGTLPSLPMHQAGRDGSVWAWTPSSRQVRHVHS